ncbi:MAG: hypothetical protein H6624_13050 [Bdellovibrionaceae bacterium]|nr:hypothetical protein [Bdellovibrionales bacterium]MCB9085270.1 hypothetical protein [Pseudobdellovibrionaceae bacterium]
MRTKTFLALLTLSWLIQAQAGKVAPLRASLDTHVHLNFEPAEAQVEKLKASGILERVDHLLLISPSYLITSGYSPSGDWQKDRQLGDRITSEVVGLLKDRATGLCGGNLLWPDLDSYLNDCLNLPGMKGLKLRNESNPYEQFTRDQVSFTNIQNTEGLSRALAKAGDKAKFVLIHLNLPFFQYRDELLEDFIEYDAMIEITESEDEDIDGKKREAIRQQALASEGFRHIAQENEITEIQNAAELQAVLPIVKKFSRVQFIFAHGANDWRNLKMINDLEAGSRLANLWIESSTTFRAVSIVASALLPASPIVKSLRAPSFSEWNRFGVHRILFGSDFSVEKYRPGRNLSLFEDMLNHLTPCSCEGSQGPCGCLTSDQSTTLTNSSGREFLNSISR